MPRRRYQELNIEISQTKRPYYFVRYRLDVIDPDGQARRKQRNHFLGYCADMTLAEAKRERDKKKNEINNLSLGQFHAIPFGAFADYWLDEIRPTISAGTAAKYESHLPRLKEAFGSWALSELDSHSLETWLNKLTRLPKAVPEGAPPPDCQPLSWNTKTDIRNVVSAIYSTAQRWSPASVLKNPAMGVKLGRKTAVYDRKRVPTTAEFHALVGGLALLPRVILVTCDLLGLRITEALGLQEKHLNLIDGRVSIEQKWYRGELGPTKTERGQRVLPLVDLVSVYGKLCTGSPEAFLFDRGKRLDGQGLVLVGEPLDDREVQKQWRKAAQASGVYWLGHGARTYRRRALTEMQRSGASAIEAMLIAGHSRPDMTAHYSLILEARADEIIKRRKIQ